VPGPNAAPVVADHVVDQFAHAVDLLVAGAADLAMVALMALDIDAIGQVRASRLASARAGSRGASSAPAGSGTARRSTTRVKLEVFQRDGWICRFCGARTIDLRVLQAVSALCPVELPFHPNWKFDASHLLYWTHSSSLEHVIPFGRGGADEVTNFVTTCYACNDARGDLLLEEIGWHLRAPVPSSWQGLTEHLTALSATSRSS
jgi:5-methylcytosine-specific restriction endonuclease McrA